MKIVNKENILKFLKENKETLKKRFKVNEIALYGSYFSEDYEFDSDIDLLVKMNREDKSFKNHLALVEFFREAFNKDIDITYVDTINPVIYDEIKKEISYV